MPAASASAGYPRITRQAGETDEPLVAPAAWRDTPCFNAADRAALALTEAVTRSATGRTRHPETLSG